MKNCLLEKLFGLSFSISLQLEG